MAGQDTLWARILRGLLRALVDSFTRPSSRRRSSRTTTRRRSTTRRSSSTGGTRSGGRTSTRSGGSSAVRATSDPSSRAPSDFHGTARISYDPHDDGRPDPGEVVWTWVPYEEDPAQGKDRPVLVIGRDHGYLLGLMLTSKDHDRDAADEARYGRVWMDIGSGPWDPRRRPSEIRLDRVLRLDAEEVRREGATLPRETFDEVAAAVRRTQGW